MAVASSIQCAGDPYGRDLFEGAGVPHGGGWDR